MLSHRSFSPRSFRPLFLLVASLYSLLLTGCDIPGLGPSESEIADSKAIGGACRHGLRNLEDCYTLNPKANMAAVIAGWKEMDRYMRENKIEGILSTVPKPEPPKPKTKKKKPVAVDEEAAALPAASASEPTAQTAAPAAAASATPSTSGHGTATPVVPAPAAKAHTGH